MMTLSTLNSKVKEIDTTWHIKLFLRQITALSALASIGMMAWVLSRWDFRVGTLQGLSVLVEDHHYALSSASIFELLSFIPLGLTFLWFVLFVMFYTLRKRPIHPGWVIGVEFVLTTAYITFAYFTFYPSLHAHRNPQNWYEILDDPIYCRNAPEPPIEVSSCLPEDQEWSATYPNVIMVLAAGRVALAFIHFVLFLWAIFDTEQRRHQPVAKRMAEDIVADMEMNRRRGPRIDEESVI